MLKRSKTGKIFADDEYLLKGRSSHYVTTKIARGRVMSQPRLLSSSFAPSFASLSYNRHGKASEEKCLTEPSLKDENDDLQAMLVEFLENQPAWRASETTTHPLSTPELLSYSSRAP
jgi:hypothetical protein